MADTETICALATAPGAAGVAITRISGPQAIEIAAKLSGQAVDRLRHARMQLVRWADATGPIDRGYQVVFKGSRSFTGEPIAELHSHGSQAVTRRLMQAISALGARPAERGEFTRRAFLAGKLDLAQAEALLELVSASTEAARTLATQHLDGQVSEAMRALRQPILAAMADVEARLDFATHEDVGEVPENLRQRLRETACELERIAATAQAGQLRMQGARVAIWGAPNAGKSTLFNALVGADKALVHDRPGTTRDALEAAGEAAGVRLMYVDLAGIRAADDEVESAGIDRARQAVQAADVILWAHDNSEPPVDVPLPSAPEHQQVIHLRTKRDLPESPEWTLHKGAERWPTITAMDKDDVVRVQTLIAKTVSALAEPVVQSDVILTRHRQANAMRRAAQSLGTALSLLDRDADLELAAADLREAADALYEVTGELAPDDILDVIFSQFCIGK